MYVYECRYKDFLKPSKTTPNRLLQSKAIKVIFLLLVVVSYTQRYNRDKFLCRVCIQTFLKRFDIMWNILAETTLERSTIHLSSLTLYYVKMPLFHCCLLTDNIKLWGGMHYRQGKESWAMFLEAPDLKNGAFKKTNVDTGGILNTQIALR